MDDRATPELLGRLLDEQAGALALFAAQWTANADDCVQEALIELARQPRLPKNPVAWLYRVVRNRAISQNRSAQRRERREQFAQRLRDRECGQASAGKGETFAEAIDSGALSAALAAIADEQREVIVARTWGGLNYQEIGALVGCSTSTAQRRYEAGLIALRERLQPVCPTHSTGQKETPPS
jgi:RNA polymerase sigma-70 factor (ECF subfamily)